MIFGANERGRVMKPYAACLAVIIGAHLASLIICDRGGGNIAGLILASLLIQGAANTVLHISFCVRGRVAPFALPLMWAFCVLPLYVYCEHIMPTAGFFGRGFAFVVYGLCVLAPALLISILTCTLFYIVKRFHK